MDKVCYVCKGETACSLTIDTGDTILTLLMCALHKELIVKCVQEMEGK